MGNNSNIAPKNVKKKNYEHEIRGINIQPSFYYNISNHIQKYHEGQATQEDKTSLQ